MRDKKDYNSIDILTNTTNELKEWSGIFRLANESLREKTDELRSSVSNLDNAMDNWYNFVDKQYEEYKREKRERRKEKAEKIKSFFKSIGSGIVKSTKKVAIWIKSKFSSKNNEDENVNQL